ncbi:sulfur carrier protein ThiS [Oceanobacillus alkalisoli]|uniref:sulfur carrier protein ThiS n=1 Tax=Oceanobacillus alkalisoli TaxID=2925113 RepID=UPI001EEFEAC1|nr:sulfur carrier protein ThiS [Oceanobacillus alkalisoli]MCF3944273.1 sulfur carrier protein ThiS [Oceanobacillus alkalisoli]MCG5105339.1 sulfur carrier protein ThiS [Oceanobacillus alkalisoli]
MTLQINGKQVELPDNVNSVKKLLLHYKLESRIAVVELNKEIVKKEEYEKRKLVNGDTLEIVHFIGGG